MYVCMYVCIYIYRNMSCHLPKIALPLCVGPNHHTATFQQGQLTAGGILRILRPGTYLSSFAGSSAFSDPPSDHDLTTADSCCQVK